MKILEGFVLSRNFLNCRSLAGARIYSLRWFYHTNYGEMLFGISTHDPGKVTAGLNIMNLPT